MSPTARILPLARPAAAFLIVVIAAGCSGKAPASAAPVTAAPAATSTACATARPSGSSATASPAAAATDAWLVARRTGAADFEVVLASTSGRMFQMPPGVPDASWNSIVTASATGAVTELRAIQLPELEGPRLNIKGAWRLPTIGDDPAPIGVSADGRTIILVEAGAKPATVTGPAARTRFAIVHRTLDSAPRIVNLAGAFEYDALSPDGSILYVVEHLAGPPDGHYQVRAVDTATGMLREGIVVDKAASDEAMAGWPIAQLRRSDGMVFTLYHGAEHPFIHALSSVDGWALCIDLPASGAADAAAATDWGLAATTDGRALVAANATLGLAVEIQFTDLAVARTGRFTPTASTGISFAKFGHQAGGAVGRRVVASPIGSVVYAAGPGGIVAIRTTDLTAGSRFLEGTAIDALAVTPDGTTIYALVHSGGRIVKLDAATGTVVGEVPGAGFDRLVAVVPW
ncbi:MAG: hypothetical protein ABI553_03000 [Chloroflexota bacterium]